MNAAGAASTAFAACAELVRQTDKDRYVATLFAPADKRPALLALYAFDIELARVPQLATQQLAGEVRLQWWREAVEGSNAHEAQANPVAQALRLIIDQYVLPVAALHEMIDARSRELYQQPFATADELLAYCDDLGGGGLICAGTILDRPALSPAGGFVSKAARAIVMSHLLMGFATRAAHGQCIVPSDTLARHNATAEDALGGLHHDGVIAALAELRALAHNHLRAAQDLLPNITATLRPAVLPLALVAPRLHWLGRHANEPYIAGDVVQWRRLWLLWREARQ